MECVVAAMGSRENLAAQVDTDAALYERFEEFREMNGFESKSEAVRQAIRRGLTDRPETPLAALLYDARQNKHTFLLVAIVAFVGGTLVPGVLAAQVVLYGISVLYSLTFLVGMADAALDERLSAPSSDASDDVERVEA